MKTRIVFQTNPVAVPPDTEGPFAGCPQTKSMNYVRYLEVPPDQYSFKPFKFYGDEYKVVSVGVSHRELIVRVTEEELVRFLAKAKATGHRWKRKAECKVDGRQLFAKHAHRMSLN